MAVRKAKKVGRNEATKLVECPLCRQRSAVSCESPDSGHFDVACPERCGAFEIEDSVAKKFRNFLNLSDLDRELLPYLRCHVRQSHERKEKARITEENWKSFADERQSTPVKDQWKRLLHLLAPRVPILGRIANIDPEVDGLLVDAPLSGDFDGLVEHLVWKGYIKRNFRADSDNEWLPNWYTLTVEGLSEYQDLTHEPLQASGGSRSGKPGPKPIKDIHHDNLLGVLREYGPSDEWADERNLETVCLHLDEKNVPVPKKWKSVENLPAPWRDPNHGAENWSEALKHGGRTPVVKVLRSRQEEARKRANSPR